LHSFTNFDTKKKPPPLNQEVHAKKTLVVDMNIAILQCSNDANGVSTSFFACKENVVVTTTMFRT
jgi:hypothetical protein